MRRNVVEAVGVLKMRRHGKIADIPHVFLHRFHYRAVGGQNAANIHGNGRRRQAQAVDSVQEEIVEIVGRFVTERVVERDFAIVEKSKNAGIRLTYTRLSPLSSLLLSVRSSIIGTDW